MSDTVTLLIRTLAQTAAGAAATWLATRGFQIDDAALQSVLFVVFSAVWATATTWLAGHVNPMFGYLSIVPKTPTYPT